MKKWIITLMMGGVLVACAGDGNTEGSATDESTEGTETVVLDEALEGLTLNDGAKWKVDTTTYDGMNLVMSIRDGFDGEDFKGLGKAIKKELKSIINKCTMRGEDHDQYHIVLHAMLEEAKELKKGHTESTEKMDGLLDAYNSHFEL